MKKVHMVSTVKTCYLIYFESKSELVKKDNV